MVLLKPRHPASAILLEYLGLLDRIYGMYVDACMGFEKIGKEMASRATPETYRKNLFLGVGDPNEADAKYNHQTTVGNAVVLNQDQVRELFTLLFDDLCALNFQQTGEKLELPFYRQLNV